MAPHKIAQPLSVVNINIHHNNTYMHTIHSILSDHNVHLRILQCNAHKLCEVHTHEEKKEPRMKETRRNFKFQALIMRTFLCISTMDMMWRNQNLKRKKKRSEN